MAKKVSKNQRTDRGKNRQKNDMVKIVVAQRKPNGQYSYRAKMVKIDEAQAEMAASRAR